MEWEGKPPLLEERRGRRGYSGGGGSSRRRKESYSLFAPSRTQYSKHRKKIKHDKGRCLKFAICLEVNLIY